MARPRISLIGAGNIGGVQAQLIAQKQLADVVLFDVVEGLPQGKALDINHALDLFGSDCGVVGTNSYEDTADSDVCIVTAGLARKPGMSRDDLLATNIRIIREVAEGIAKASPDTVVIVLSNPLDAMVYAMKQITGFPKQRVFGQAGVLDSARFKFFVAEALGVSVRDVIALVLGGHGDTMVPLPRHCSVNGVPLLELMDRASVDAIVKRVRGAGGEVVGLLKTGSAFVSPAAASVAMAEAVLLDQKRVLPCAAYLEGEYGASGIYMGVPVVVGAGGAERILELELNGEENELMQQSIAHVEKLVGALDL